MPILFKCMGCKFQNYLSQRKIDKTITNKKLELKKFCKNCRKHVTHIEQKVD
ncbi:50S ribosomal protein L33 [Candidatus Mycoplasma haematominutum]|uniref:50S ribosomal protein L33 n=1 Tax=Candidatus Mycoplasma haematominutum TaxID=209446 RepID=UPI001FE20F57|nr:50S ribosomal protein L33 [Candidatus Mycoplasma haematominutum]